MFIETADTKMLTVSKLKELLATLPDNYYILPNKVGNLTITNEDFNYAGYIDFLEESVALFDSN